MTMIVVSLSFQSVPETLPNFTGDVLGRAESDAALLRPMTFIFRQAFRRIFAHVAMFEGEHHAAAVPGIDVSLVRAAVFHGSSQTTIGDDGCDVLLVGLLEVTSPEAGADVHALWRARYGTPEAKMLLLRTLGLEDAADLFVAVPGRIVGQTSTPLEIDHRGREPTLLAIFAFYAAGWLRALRIERRQLSTELQSVSESDLRAGVEISNQRLRILDQQRYFLTADRTNDTELRTFCTSLLGKFKLPERHHRALELHTAFEHHLDNATKLYSANRLGSVSNLILLLTILSVPISVFSAIFAINLKSEAFEHPLNMLVDARLYAALLVGAAIVAIPFVALKLLDRTWRSRGGQFGADG